MTVALSIDNLTLIRGGRALIRGLSLGVKAGEIVSLEGPNGAGKTSLLRAIAGLLPQTGGTIMITSQGVTATDREDRSNFIGWLSHLDGIKGQLTVREQAKFWATLFKSHGNVDAAITRFGLMRIGDARGAVLSAGQKRRLALVRLVLAARPVWLLDEPLAALDTAGKALVASAIIEHATQGGIVIAATHDPLGVACQTLRVGAA